MGHIWDPRIHDRFHHESFLCTFVTLSRPERGRLRDGNNVYEQFCDELHAALGKEGVTTYSLFGRYDVLLQSWCDEDKAYRLHTHITTSNLVRSSLFYAYRQIAHLWAEDVQKRSFNDLELHKVNESFVRKVQEGDASSVDQALKSRFLLPRPDRQTNHSWVKFFTLLPLLDPFRDDDEGRAKNHFWPQVIEGIKGAQTQIEQVNELTVGLIGEMPNPHGLGDTATPPFIGGVVIEGRVAAAQLDKILPFGFLATRVDHQLRGGSETYIVATAESNWRESDEITAFGEMVGTEQLRKLKSLFRLNADEIIRLDSRRCAWVLQQTTKHTELIELERVALSKSILLAWLRAYLCDDHEQAFRTLAVLMKIEGLLAEAMKKLLGNKSAGRALEAGLLPQLFETELKTGNAAGNVVIVEQAKSGTAEAKIGKISKFTLADWINILERVNHGRLSTDDKGTVERLCGDPGALDTLREMIPGSSTQDRGWRNKYAHGDLNRPLPKKDVMDDQMQKLTEFLARLAWIVSHLDGNEAGVTTSSVPAKVTQ